MASYPPPAPYTTCCVKLKLGDVQGFPEEQSKLLAPGCRFSHVKGDPASSESLRRAGAQGAQAIIIGGLQRRPAKEADALTLSLILLLQGELLSSGRSPDFPAHIVGMVGPSLRFRCGVV